MSVLLHSLRLICSPGTSDTLETVARLFYQQFHASVREGNIPPHQIRSLLLEVAHLDPSVVMDSGEVGFLWISKILNSRYPEEGRYLAASAAVRILEGRSFYMRSAWAPPLLKSLSRCENFPTTASPPHPGLIALRILLDKLRHPDFDAALLPVLPSMLSPGHPLQSRKMPLAAFNHFMSEWFSSQSETISGDHLNKLLRAIDDPFRFPPELHQDGVLEGTVRYRSTKVVIALIEFASPEMWWRHLPSNFTSCKDIVSRNRGSTVIL